eukprot:scaffold29974_cov60-Cyclotella_meneghiniana.AAC.6
MKKSSESRLSTHQQGCSYGVVSSLKCPSQTQTTDLFAQRDDNNTVVLEMLIDFMLVMCSVAISKFALLICDDIVVNLSWTRHDMLTIFSEDNVASRHNPKDMVVMK